jgi:hypothetical protein
MPCCGEPAHAWDQFRVAMEWMPHPLRCLIVGENPGSVSTGYFYDGDRGVAVRTVLLGGLHCAGIIEASTLDAFRASGFLFDHGIRCHLTGDAVATERRLARTSSSTRASAATHLTPYIRTASAVWVMGYVASNAVAAPCSGFPRDMRDVALCPYPMQILEAPKFIVSRYLTRASGADVAAIFRAFVTFWAQRSGGDGGPSNSAVHRTGGSRCSPSGR